MAFDRLICMPLGVGSSGHDGTSCCNHVLIISKWTWHSTLRFIKYLWRIMCIKRVCVCARVCNQLMINWHCHTLAKCLATISLASAIYFRICVMCVSYSGEFTCSAFIHFVLIGVSTSLKTDQSNLFEHWTISLFFPFTSSSHEHCKLHEAIIITFIFWRPTHTFSFRHTFSTNGSWLEWVIKANAAQIHHSLDAQINKRFVISWTKGSSIRNCECGELAASASFIWGFKNQL